MSSVFKIYSPEDCDFYYDGELQGHIEGKSKKAFRFEVERKGMSRLVFINSEYQTELITTISIDADEEREVELDFSEVNEPVIQERERIIIAIEHDYGGAKRLPEEIISAISKNGIVTIPQGVKKIGDHAFSACSSLTSITIPDSVTEIGDHAFSACSSLTSITIPDSVNKIGNSAFYSCNSLTAFYGKYASYDNRCLIKDGRLLAFAPYDITKYSIPNGVTKIEKKAFSLCFRLTSVTIPDSVTEIGDRAFNDCRNLTSVTIPNSVTEIGFYAFYGCRSLTSVYFKATTPPNIVTWREIFRKGLKIFVPKSADSAVLKAYKYAGFFWEDYKFDFHEYDIDYE